MSISIRDTFEQPTGMAALYCIAHDNIIEKVPSKVKQIVSQNSHALFTFLVVLPIQLLFMAAVFPNSDEGGFLIRNLNVVLVLLGGAVLRCFIGYLISGKVLEVGALYDYVSLDSQKSDKKKAL